MRTLNILVCGSDTPTMQGLTRILVDEGVLVKFSDHVIEDLSFSSQNWDFLLIDLGSLTSHLRNLLPVIRRKFPHLQVIGISPDFASPLPISTPMMLDGHYTEIPSPEELIVRYPRVALKYMA